MLIDDDLPTSFLTQILITKQKVCKEVIKMLSAKAALEYLASKACLNGEVSCPDIIFLDIAMPEINGWEFLEKYSTLKSALPKQPCIYILSAFALEQDFLKFVNAQNLSGICEKPLTKEILKSILAKFLAEKNKNSESFPSL